MIPFVIEYQKQNTYKNFQFQASTNPYQQQFKLEPDKSDDSDYMIQQGRWKLFKTGCAKSS